MTKRVLATVPGIRVPFMSAEGGVCRSSTGALSITDEGLLYEDTGRLKRGPVVVDDTPFLRQCFREGTLREVTEDAPPKTAKRDRGEVS